MIEQVITFLKTFGEMTYTRNGPDFTGWLDVGGKRYYICIEEENDEY